MRAQDEPEECANDGEEQEERQDAALARHLINMAGGNSEWLRVDTRRYRDRRGYLEPNFILWREDFSRRMGFGW